MAPMTRNHRLSSSTGSAPSAQHLAQLVALVALLVVPSVAGCSTGRWDGEVLRAGSLDTAMRPLGASLMDATREHSYGLGLLESAAGVVIVLDGHVWIGRALSADRARTDAGFPPGAGASWMVRADVPRWRREALREPLDLEGLAARVAELARAEGWEVGRPLPFMVEGQLEALSASIVRGAPPTHGSQPAGREPFRAHLREASGVLVGVHAPGADGLHVMPGDALRVHALVREPTVLAAQVDAVRIQRGARISIPARRGGG